MKKILGLALLAVLSRCTVKVPIAPQDTDESSWTPTLAFIGSGYQRFAIDMDDPPTPQIDRNLRHYLVE